MSIDDAIYCLKAGSDKFPQACEYCQYYKPAEISGMDICEWIEDYDYEDNNISEYEYETTVDDFLIEETKEEE